ncbi:MAG: nucleotidyltransferase family protein [Streptococcus sp.]
MRVTGIIAEFNPFHNGHKYLLDQAEGVKCCYVWELCSAGEPAIVDKWTRIDGFGNGADLVVELPFFTSVQSADYFALEPSSCPDWELIALLLARKKSRLPGDRMSMLKSQRKWKPLWKVYRVTCLIHKRRKKCGKSLLVWILLAIHPTIS